MYLCLFPQPTLVEQGIPLVFRNFVIFLRPCEKVSLACKNFQGSAQNKFSHGHKNSSFRQKYQLMTNSLLVSLLETFVTIKFNFSSTEVWKQGSKLGKSVKYGHRREQYKKENCIFHSRKILSGNSTDPRNVLALGRYAPSCKNQSRVSLCARKYYFHTYERNIYYHQIDSRRQENRQGSFILNKL